MTGGLWPRPSAGDTHPDIVIYRALKAVDDIYAW